MARLVDRAVVRYREASAHLDDWIATRHQGNESSRFRWVSAIEEAVTLTHRATGHAIAGKRVGIIEVSLLPTKSDRRDVKEMRDAIQHTEDRITHRRSPTIRHRPCHKRGPHDREISALDQPVNTLATDCGNQRPPRFDPTPSEFNWSAI
jgi:hypothetical protein